MTHVCSTLVLHCMDFRLGKAIRDELERRGLLNDCDIVAIAGAAKTLVSDTPAAWHETALAHIALSQKLHGISRVLLINHTDCGAYGGRSTFANAEAEEERHHADLRAASTVVRKAHPDLEVSLVLAQIAHSGAINFEDVPASS